MKNRLFLIISAVILITGIIGAIAFRAPMKTYSIQFVCKNGKTGYAKVYIPDSPAGDNKYPIVYLCPGIITPHQRMDYIAGELCRRGYAACSVFIPLWQPRKNLDTLRSAMKHLRENFGMIDHNKAATLGHSLGGTTAVDASLQDPAIQACSSVGFYIGGELTLQPKNLLLATGLHDDLNDPDKMRRSMASLTDGKVAKEDVMVGNFQNKSARYLFISPFSAHHSEMVDFYITQQFLNWLHLSLYGTPEPNLDISFVKYIIFGQILMAGLYLCLVPALMFFSIKVGKNFGKFIFAVLFLSTLTLTFAPVPPVPFARGTAFLFLAFITSAYYLKKHQNKFDEAYNDFLVFVKKVAAVGVLFIFALVVSQFVFSLNLLLQKKEYLMGFPGYIMVTFQLVSCNIALSAVNFLKQVIPWIFLILFAPLLLVALGEIRKPGWSGEFLLNWFKKAESFCRFEKGTKITTKQIIILAILLCLVALSWFYLYWSGLFKPAILWQYSTFIIRYIALPLLLFVLLLKINIVKKSLKSQ